MTQFFKNKIITNSDYYFFETINDHLWLQLARMELDCKLINFDKFGPCALEI